MSEEASSSAGDPQGKNFRRAYYESLLFRGEEEEKNVGCLESLLKAECIDVESLKQFCQKHTLPPYHRLQVWNIILGVVPPYNDEETCTHVSRQREQQFLELRQALFVFLTTPLHHHHHHHPSWKDLEPSEKLRLSPEQLVLMYLLQGNHLPTSASVGRARLQYRDSVPLARVFLELCDLDREAYWLFARFRQMMDGVDSGLLRKSCFQYVEREDSALSAHLTSLSDGIPFSLWFNQCFASTLPETCLEGVWDRLIGGCVMILVFLAIAILLTFKRRLLGARSLSVIADVLTQIPEENCVLIVMKAVELWEASGCPLLPSPHLLPSPSPHPPSHRHTSDRPTE